MVADLDHHAPGVSKFKKTSFVQLMLERERKGGPSLGKNPGFSPHARATTYINSAKRSRTNTALVKLRNLSENARRTNQVQTANRIVEDERVFTSLYSDLEHDRGVSLSIGLINNMFDHLLTKDPTSGAENS